MSPLCLYRRKKKRRKEEKKKEEEMKMKMNGASFFVLILSASRLSGLTDGFGSFKLTPYSLPLARTGGPVVTVKVRSSGGVAAFMSGQASDNKSGGDDDDDDGADGSAGGGGGQSSGLPRSRITTINDRLMSKIESPERGGSKRSKLQETVSRVLATKERPTDEQRKDNIRRAKDLNGLDPVQTTSIGFVTLSVGLLSFKYVLLDLIVPTFATKFSQTTDQIYVVQRATGVFKTVGEILGDAI